MTQSRKEPFKTCRICKNHRKIIAHLHAFTSPRLHAYTPTHLEAYKPTHLHAYTHTHLHTHGLSSVRIPTYLHAYTPTRTWAFLTSEHGLVPLYDLIMFRLGGSHFSSKSGPGPFWLPKPFKFKDFLHLAETPWRRRNLWSCSPLAFFKDEEEEKREP